MDEETGRDRESSPETQANQWPDRPLREVPPLSWLFQEDFWRSITIGALSGIIVVIVGLLTAAALGFIQSDDETILSASLGGSILLIVAALMAAAVTHAVRGLRAAARGKPWPAEAGYALAWSIAGVGVAVFSWPLLQPVVDYLFGDLLNFIGAFRDFFG